MTAVTTSLVVRFSPSSAGSAGRLTAEIDSRPDGLNKGKTSFAPGDSVGFLVYAGEGVSITAVVPTLGTVGNVGAQSVAIEEFVQFANVAEASLRAPASGGVAAQWVGRDGGNFSIVNGIVTLDEPGIGMLHASYSATAQGYVLSGIPAEVAGLTEFEVLVYIEGEYSG